MNVSPKRHIIWSYIAEDSTVPFLYDCDILREQMQEMPDFGNSKISRKIAATLTLMMTEHHYALSDAEIR
jgi:hypothetical protein